MPRVDFYILPKATDRRRFLGQLTGKIWGSGNTVYIHADSETEADALDESLWTYRDISFLPHEKMADGEQKSEAPITIGWRDVVAGRADVLINLAGEVPEFADDFNRIVEIAGGDEHQKQMARQRYRHYRRQNYELHDHNIDVL